MEVSWFRTLCCSRSWLCHVEPTILSRGSECVWGKCETIRNNLKLKQNWTQKHHKNSKHTQNSSEFCFPFSPPGSPLSGICHENHANGGCPGESWSNAKTEDWVSWVEIYLRLSPAILWRNLHSAACILYLVPSIIIHIMITEEGRNLTETFGLEPFLTTTE